jgi:hypothetical protein
LQSVYEYNEREAEADDRRADKKQCAKEALVVVPLVVHRNETVTTRASPNRDDGLAEDGDREGGLTATLPYRLRSERTSVFGHRCIATDGVERESKG